MRDIPSRSTLALQRYFFTTEHTESTENREGEASGLLGQDAVHLAAFRDDETTFNRDAQDGQDWEPGASCVSCLSLLKVVVGRPSFSVCSVISVVKSLVVVVLGCALAALLCGLPASAQDDEPIDLPPAFEDAEVSREEIAARLSGLESRLDTLEEKIDRLDELLRLLFASKLRRVELLRGNEELGRAIPAVEERYSIRNVAEALTEEDPEKLASLRRSLAGASARAGAAEFASDADVAEVLAAMAQRGDFLARHGRTFLAGLAGRDKEALGKLVLALLERDAAGAREAALWGASRAAGDPLAGRLSEFAREADQGNRRIYALAQAAAAAHGDGEAAERLTVAVREGSVDGAFANQLAGELAGAGSRAAFHVYLELLRDERYAFAASQAFNRIRGFDRRIGAREARENREGLHEEVRAWLERNREKLRYEAETRRFTVE